MDPSNEQGATGETLPWAAPTMRRRFVWVMTVKLHYESRIQDVPCRYPALLLRAVSLPVYQVLKLPPLSPGVQQPTDSVDWRPIYHI